MAGKSGFLILSVSLLAILGSPIVTLAQSVVWPVQAQAAVAGGSEVRSEAGRFTVQMPTAPEATTSTTTVSGDTLTWTIAQAKTPDSVYAVAYTDLPLDVLAMGRDAVIDSLREHPLVQGFDWQAIANRGHRISLGELPGIEFLNVEAGQTSALRFYLANRRLYAVMASAGDLQGVHQFLNSFAIDSLWQPFTHNDGGFRVDLPMAPVFTPQQMPYQGETLNWWQYTGHNLLAPADRYGVAYTVLPNRLQSRSPSAILDEVAQMVLPSIQAETLVGSGSPITLNGHPGQEYQLTTASGQVYVLRFYLVQDHLYSLLATSRSLDNLDRFLSSFQVQ